MKTPAQPMTGRGLIITIRSTDYVVTFEAPVPSGGLWEARKRIEAAIRATVQTRDEIESQNNGVPRP